MDLTLWSTLNENIRTVELPQLSSVKERELGGVIMGDWLALINPVMRDLSMSSSMWWEAVLSSANAAYSEWLHSDPLKRLYVRPGPVVNQAWTRIEQRAQTMLLGAVSDSLRSEILSGRMTSCVEIMYKIFTRYQPGGLGEKALVLRQLTEVKAPNTMGDTLEALRGWKRCLQRALELGVSTPDPTLLMSTLDRLGAVVNRSSTQAAFRLSSTRAMLQVDVCPNHVTVVNYADALLAEAEGVFHGGGQSQPTPKVKAVNGTGVGGDQSKDSQVGKGGSKGKTSDRQEGPGGGRKPFPCRFFGSEDGCKKGADCTYQHDWTGIDRRGRCWKCSSTKHTQRDCTVSTAMKAMDGPGSGGLDSGGKGGSKGGGKSKDASSTTTPTLKKTTEHEDDSKKTKVVEKESESSSSATTSEAIPNQGGAEKESPSSLILEATSLLKTLRGPAVRAVRLSSLEVQKQNRVLLDGGATHALRTAKDEKEWRSAVEVRVDLAQGSVMLKQLPWGKTLLSRDPVQPIVPLGVLIEIGYVVHWSNQVFELQDPTGCIVDTELENGCPTVSMELGLELIKEVERHFVERRARLAVLQGDGNPGGLDDSVVQGLTELKQMFPEVPDEIIERILP